MLQIFLKGDNNKIALYFKVKQRSISDLILLALLNTNNEMSGKPQLANTGRVSTFTS